MRILVRSLALSIVALVVAAGVLAAHDMFLRPAQHFVAPNSSVLVRLFNGTFSQSENSISRDRLQDVAIVAPTGRTRLDTARWSVEGDTSTFTLNATTPGTYVLGASTRPRVLALAGKEFNAYLADDGIPDELAARTKEGRLNDGSRERYHKHVKALVQVGDTPDMGYSAVLGYPAEIIPLQNPYALKVGASLDLRLLVSGKPIGGQFVQYGGRTPANGRVAQRSVRSSAAGVARIPLDRTGTYYVKFIDMRRLANDTEANYESRWATLTFAVR
ncbi:MAG: DUF4198 domain-containing protein [Gemmatimonadota bacterium]